MRYLYLFLILTGCYNFVYSQGIGINTTNTPSAPSSILDITSNTKGILFPRLTSSQRFAIVNPANGLLVFDTDLSCFAYHLSSKWYTLCGTKASDIHHFEIVSGNMQNGCSNALLNAPVVLQLKDANNQVVAGENVTITVSSGGGSTNVSAATTNASGQIQFSWTTGSTGPQTVQVSTLGGINIEVNASAVNLIASTGTFTDTRDGNVYTTVTYCNGVTWFSQNLNHNVSGSYYNTSNPSSNYGRLYTWAQVMQGAASSNSNPSGVQGACPSGWHIPSETEWQVLEILLGMNVASSASGGWRGTNQGTQMKSTTGWSSGGNGTNSAGFNAFPSGFYHRGSYQGLGTFTRMWTSTTNAGNPTVNAHSRYLSNTNADVHSAIDTHAAGYACRCVLD